MRIFVTGGTGFIGRAVVATALARGHEVTALARSQSRARDVLPRHENLEIVTGDIAGYAPDAAYDRLIDLAWDQTEKPTSPRALTLNLEPHFSFLQRMIGAGTRNLCVAGTCYEYGMQEGALAEDTPARPATHYGLAKDTLRRMLGLVPDIKLKWLRYFYVYGPGQRAGAFLPLLLAAVARGAETFDMSPGDQARDFIHVETAAHNTLALAEHDGTGIFNVGSGRAVRVADFARDVLKRKNSAMKLNTGAYPYLPYEPFSFHADVKKLKTIEGARFDDAIRV